MRAPTPRRPRRRGLTLIELVLVMGVAALVLGMGLGAIASVDLGARSAAGVVQGALRSASHWAAARRAPARVRIDRAERTLRVEGQDVIGTWHFESELLRGAFGLDGELIGARLVEDGFVGRALGLRGGPSQARVVVPVQKSPAYDFAGGFQLQLALRPEGTGGGAVLAIGDSLALLAMPRFALEASFAAVRTSESGGVVRAGRVRARTPEGALWPDRWNRVLVSYDRRELAIWVEGVKVAAFEDDAAVAPIEGPLVLGGGREPWAGSLDSLVISAVNAAEVVQLPDTVAFSADAPAEVVFAPGGGLDRSVHAAPVRFALEFLDGRRAVVQVSLYGTVE